MRATAGRNLRVATFLAVGFMVLAGVIVVIGQKSGLFEAKATLHAHFPDVGGLVVGAPVRLAGLDIGTVEAIELSVVGNQTTAHVELSVREKYLSRLHADSRASIGSKGLLGDKLIELSVGTVDGPTLRDGDQVDVVDGMSFGQLADKLEGAVGSITRAADAAERAVDQLVTEQARDDVSRILHSFANLLETLESGDTVLHRLLYDEALANDVSQAAAQSRHVLTDMRRVSQRLDRLLATVESGPGSAHDLVYGDAASQLVADTTQTSQALRGLVEDLRGGDGFVPQLLHGPEGKQMLSDLAGMTAAAQRMTASIERGEGTLGGLVVDPTVYEDLKTILGNIERNVLLKALVRFAIKEGDIERPTTPVSTPEGAE